MKAAEDAPEQYDRSPAARFGRKLLQGSQLYMPVSLRLIEPIGEWKSNSKHFKKHNDMLREFSDLITSSQGLSIPPTYSGTLDEIRDKFEREIDVGNNWIQPTFENFFQRMNGDKHPIFVGNAELVWDSAMYVLDGKFDKNRNMRNMFYHPYAREVLTNKKWASAKSESRKRFVACGSYIPPWDKADNKGNRDWASLPFNFGCTSLLLPTFYRHGLDPLCRLYKMNKPAKAQRMPFEEYGEASHWRHFDWVERFIFMTHRLVVRQAKQQMVMDRYIITQLRQFKFDSDTAAILRQRLKNQHTPAVPQQWLYSQYLQYEDNKYTFAMFKPFDEKWEKQVNNPTPPLGSRWITKDSYSVGRGSSICDRIYSIVVVGTLHDTINTVLKYGVDPELPKARFGYRDKLSEFRTYLE